MSDVRRETLRSRVGFWCHACAGFLLAHSMMMILAGRSDSASSWHALYSGEPRVLSAPAGVIFLGLSAFGTIVALIVDRRSFIFSALFQVVAVTALVLGNGLLALGLVGGLLLGVALGWQRLRAALLALLPTAVAAQLPRTDLVARGRRPTRRQEEMLPLRYRALGQDAPLQR